MRRCFWSWSRANGLALCCSKDGEGSTGQKSSFKLQQFKSLTPAKKSSIHRGVRHLWWSILCFQQLCLTALVQQHSISAWCTEPVVIIVQFEFVVPFQDFLAGHPWTALLEKMEGGLLSQQFNQHDLRSCMFLRIGQLAAHHKPQERINHYYSGSNKHDKHCGNFWLIYAPLGSGPQITTDALFSQMLSTKTLTWPRHGPDPCFLDRNDRPGPWWWPGTPLESDERNVKNSQLSLTQV